MSDYTPGPWRVGTNGPNGLLTVGTERGLMVAMAAHSIYVPDQAEQARGNARLIAAAPDLLAAAEGVMGDELDLSQCPYFMGTGQCSSGCYSEPSCQTDRPLNGWPKERLAAAIKKSKGQL